MIPTNFQYGAIVRKVQPCYLYILLVLRHVTEDSLFVLQLKVRESTKISHLLETVDAFQTYQHSRRRSREITLEEFDILLR